MTEEAAPSGASGPAELLIDAVFAVAGFPATGQPCEARIEDLIAVAEEHSMMVAFYRFAELPPGQTLAQLVHELLDAGTCPGPHSPVRAGEGGLPRQTCHAGGLHAELEQPPWGLYW